jgi:hypothetical protein
MDVRGSLSWPRRRWEDNIRIVPREIWWEGVDWMRVAKDKGQWRAVVNTVMKLRVPYDEGNILTGWATIILSIRTPLHGVSYVYMCVYIWYKEILSLAVKFMKFPTYVRTKYCSKFNSRLQSELCVKRGISIIQSQLLSSLELITMAVEINSEDTVSTHPHVDTKTRTRPE